MAADATQSWIETIEELVAALTLEEKVLLLEGMDFWKTRGIDRLGIPSLFLTDGPHGVRKAREATGAFGVADNIPSTAYPPAATVANTWAPEIARKMGAAIARESVDRGVHVLLAPGANIKRNPLCGRNFEYFSEDPLVSGLFGSAFVQGVQSEGVATSVKHFAANSNEDYRFVGDSLVDERALREIYLRQFERIVTEAAPATVMTAYNAISGTFSSDNHRLLTGILRDEWGFDGVVMTDWGATHDRVQSLFAGCELDMPGDNPHNRAQVLAAVHDGRIPVATLDEAVRRLLTLVAEYYRQPPTTELSDPVAHADLAREIAVEGAVLLSNDGTLPLHPEAPGLVVVGEMFDRMRFQGAGSSLINPTSLVSPRDAFDHRQISYTYARGYRGTFPDADPELEREALAAARPGSVVLFFGGLTDLEESEGFDRNSMALPENQTALLAELAAVGARVVLVLFAGAPVELPFADDLAAVLDMYLPGMQGGEAVAELLFGEANPSGKLTESWTRTAAEASSSADYGRDPVAQYYESVYVGYRHYDAAGTKLQYPFGHGLSYTTFEYRNLQTSVVDGVVEVTLDVANTGSRDGAEVVQLYVRNNRGQVFKPDKELRAFTKVRVPAGESAPARLTFRVDDLAYWDIADNGWRLENGEYEILAGSSAVDIRLSSPLVVTTGEPSRSPYPVAVDHDYAAPPASIPESFPALLGRDVPTSARSRRLGMETRLVDARHSLIGGFMYRAVVSRVEKDYRAALALPDGIERDAQVKNSHFVWRMMPFNSLRSMAMSSAGAFPFSVATGIADIAEGRVMRGIRSLLRRR